MKRNHIKLFKYTITSLHYPTNILSSQSTQSVKKSSSFVIFFFPNIRHRSTYFYFRLLSKNIRTNIYHNDLRFVVSPRRVNNSLTVITHAILISLIVLRPTRSYTSPILLWRHLSIGNVF